MSEKLTAEKLILNTLDDWAMLYGRTLDDGARMQWVKMFKFVPMRTLERALESVTAESKRFPTPGDVTTAVRDIRATVTVASAGSDANYIEPHVDEAGVKCRRNRRTGEIYYRAIDCKEGRECLMALAQVAGKPMNEIQAMFDKWNEAPPPNPAAQGFELKP